MPRPGSEAAAETGSETETGTETRNRDRDGPLLLRVSQRRVVRWSARVRCGIVGRGFSQRSFSAPPLGARSWVFGRRAGL